MRAFLQSLSPQPGALVAAEAVALVAQTSAIAIAYRSCRPVMLTVSPAIAALQLLLVRRPRR